MLAFIAILWVLSENADSPGEAQEFTFSQHPWSCCCRKITNPFLHETLPYSTGYSGETLADGTVVGERTCPLSEPSDRGESAAKSAQGAPPGRRATALACAWRNPGRPFQQD